MVQSESEYREPVEPMMKFPAGGETWRSSRERENFLFSTFCSILDLKNGMMYTCIGEDGSSLLKSAESDANLLQKHCTDTSRHDILPILWAFLLPCNLTYEINHHTSHLSSLFTDLTP